MQFKMAFLWWLYHEYATLVLEISYQLCLLFEYVDDNLHESMQTVHVGDQTEHILNCPTLLISLQISKLPVLLEPQWWERSVKSTRSDDGILFCIAFHEKFQLHRPELLSFQVAQTARPSPIVASRRHDIIQLQQ